MGIWLRNFDELKPNEHCLLSVVAKSLTGRTDMGGRLRVTSLGLQFRPNRVDSLFRAGAGEWECDLSELTAAHVSPGGAARLRGNGPAGLRAKIVLEGTWGKAERIMVSDPQSVIDTIATAQGSSSSVA